jgi:hypothetical protein
VNRRMNLEDFATPIVSGLTPCPTGGLSRDRVAVLDRRLRELARARAAALLASRSYLIIPGSSSE